DLAGVEPVREVNQRLRAPKHCAELAELVCRWHIIFHQVEKLRSKTIIDVLKKTDAFRRPERFQTALNVCIADTQGRLNREHTPYPQRAHWLALLEAANQADSGKIAAECRAQGKAHLIAEQIDRARLAQIAPLQKAFRAAQDKTEKH
ncbi:multifunctional CCA tRNA nucleotidyl transferase/2'3'-cyclic phosphodiesterase/2'nucleotidase/phosphatase, partial [Neisseria meningitidis]|nr:multifunctional CCA tRNA nucleotidyl transferase/2'3'-cyclic phosphodiesterase/2'nucleotidase/phosphatase [Neisseria meningitidis]